MASEGVMINQIQRHENSHRGENNGLCKTMIQKHINTSLINTEFVKNQLMTITEVKHTKTPYRDICLKAGCENVPQGKNEYFRRVATPFKSAICNSPAPPKTFLLSRDKVSSLKVDVRQTTQAGRPVFRRNGRRLVVRSLENVTNTDMSTTKDILKLNGGIKSYSCHLLPDIKEHKTRRHAFLQTVISKLNDKNPNITTDTDSITKDKISSLRDINFNKFSLTNKEKDLAGYESDDSVTSSVNNGSYMDVSDSEDELEDSPPPATQRHLNEKVNQYLYGVFQAQQQ